MLPEEKIRQPVYIPEVKPQRGWCRKYNIYQVARADESYSRHTYLAFMVKRLQTPSKIIDAMLVITIDYGFEFRSNK